MSQTNVSRRHSQNINTDRVEYHLIDTPTSTEIAEAYTSYTFIPAPEAITLIAEQPKIIKISGYHYRLLGTVDPGGQTWTSNTNLFTAIYSNGSYITPYISASANTTAYLKIGTDVKGYKFYQKVNEDSYYELIGKMPNELEYGEVGVGRSANNEVMYIKNSDGQMVEFRSYKANMDYVNNEITDVYNLIYSIHYSPSLSVSPSTFFKSTSSRSITAYAKLLFNGVAQQMTSINGPIFTTEPTSYDTWSAWTWDASNGRYYSTNTIKMSSESSNTATISATLVKDAYSKTLTASFTAVNHIFYGKSSATDTTSLTGLTAYTSPTTTPNGRNYQVSMASGDYFYIAVPSSLTQPSQVGTGGASGFFESLSLAGTANVGDTITGVSEEYKFYRTQSGQAAGTFNYYVK